MKIIYGILLGVLLMFNTAFAADAGYGAKGAINTPQPTVQEMLTFAIQDEYFQLHALNPNLHKHRLCDPLR